MILIIDFAVKISTCGKTIWTKSALVTPRVPSVDLQYPPTPCVMKTETTTNPLYQWEQDMLHEATVREAWISSTFTLIVENLRQSIDVEIIQWNLEIWNEQGCSSEASRAQ